MLVTVAGAEPLRFDHVVIATHSDQALAMLADASWREREILGAIPYQENEAVLHTDRSLLPTRRRAWASWNYHLLERAGGRATVTYHLNRLQAACRADEQFCVTLNLVERIDPALVLKRIDVRAPRLHAGGRRRAAPCGRDLRARGPHALLRRLLGMGLPRGRRATARCAWPRASEARL